MDGSLPEGVTQLPSLNHDGSILVFESEAPNLVPDDTNFSSDIFMLRDGVLERISLMADGAEASGDSTRPEISADGRYVVFASKAQLDPIDGNGVSDIYVYSTLTRQTALVSRGRQDAAANGASDVPSISKDGRYIVFMSTASNLIESDDNGFSDVFLATNPFLGVLENAFGSSQRVVPGQLQGPSFALVPKPSSVSGSVYEDAVNNNAIDPGERGFADVLVYLDLNRNGLFDDGEPGQLTDENGDFVFNALPSNRDYSLSVIAPSEFVQVPLGPNLFNHEFFLPPASSLAGRDFGFRPSEGSGQSGDSAVAGRIYRDTNGNGAFDAGIDIALAGTTVYLDAENFGVRDINEPAVLTDAEGRYEIDQLGSRVVAVSALLPNEFVSVSPRGSEFELARFPLFDKIVPFGNAQSIASADFNGDSFPDVATALAEANQISIRINDGQGGFLPQGIDVDLGEDGAGPIALVVGQFNGAGTPKDLAVVNILRSNVIVLTDFSGTGFESRQTIAVGEEPIDIATAAIFGDSDHLDLVVANKAANTIQILRNDASGQFQALPAIASGGASPVAVVTGEFTRDSQIDVAVLHSKPVDLSTPFGDVRVLRGDGNGNFTLTATRYEVGALPTDLIAANFDGDASGTIDLAVANFGSNTISILTGDQQGGFTVQPQTLGTSSGALDIAAGDIDNDGDVDVIASNLRDRNISIFRNVTQLPGSTSFEPLQAVGLGQFGFAQRMPLTLANFDGDQRSSNQGTIDIVSIPSGTDTLHVLTNTLINGAHRVELTGIYQVNNLDFRVQPASLPPAIDPIPDPLPVVEDAGTQTIKLTGIRKGRPQGPDLRISAISSNPDLLPPPSIVPDASGLTATLSYRTRPDANGQAAVIVNITDAGADGLFDTSDDTFAEQRFLVTVLSSNDPPLLTFSQGEVNVNDDAGPQVVEGFVNFISPGGGSDELTQGLSDLLVSSQANLFSDPPTIDRQGTLRFTPLVGVQGTTLVNVQLTDTGGTENSGRDSAQFSFAIAVVSKRPQTVVLDGNANTFFLNLPGLNPDSLQLIDIRGAGDNTLVLDAENIRSVFPNGQIRVIANAGDQIRFDSGWQFQSAQLIDSDLVRRFVHSNGAVLNLIGPADFTNPMDRFDINASGDVTAQDALQIINELSRRRFIDEQSEIVDVSGSGLDQFRFFDVNSDNRITALDAVQVVNAIARRRVESEAEELTFAGLMSREDAVDYIFTERLF